MPPPGPELRVDLGKGLHSLDPAVVTDPASGNVLNAIFDPLVRLDDGKGPVPALARSWDVSEKGRVITFHLRPAGVWTNGDPVTATDFEYAWKRAMAPRFATANADRFGDIVGASAYTACDSKTDDCDALRAKVGVEALDDVTLQVTLKKPEPWFVQEVAYWAFLPVHEPTVERYKRHWTDAAHIVTDGPFRLVDWAPRTGVVLDRWRPWRDARDVQLARIEGRVYPDASAGLAAFQAGQVDACLGNACVTSENVRSVASSPEFATFPAPATAFLGINLERLPDEAQRKAIAIALNRKALVTNGTTGTETPATALTPQGLPGFGLIDQSYLTDQARRPKAKRLIKRSDDAKTKLKLGYGPGEDALAALVQKQLGKVGLDVTLEKRPSDRLKGIDLYLGNVTADGADAIDVLGRWTCDAGDNLTGFCNKEYDRLASEARTTVDPDERYALYGELESMLTGKKGQFPAVPVYWNTIELLRKTGVDGFEPDLLGLVDFTRVTIATS